MVIKSHDKGLFCGRHCEKHFYVIVHLIFAIVSNGHQNSPPWQLRTWSRNSEGWKNIPQSHSLSQEANPRWFNFRGTPSTGMSKEWVEITDTRKFPKAKKRSELKQEHSKRGQELGQYNYLLSRIWANMNLTHILLHTAFLILPTPTHTHHPTSFEEA